MPGTTPGSSLLEFYDDAKIFITGGTGFLGKVLIEKFLRIFPNVNHIYVLIRMKKGKDPQSRVKEIFEDPLFQTLRKERPDFEKKVTCIPGDVSAEGLDMSYNDYEFLVNEVTHVFHSAATVRFNEKLDRAVAINVLGTQEAVKFCKKCIRLKVFVHISTAYANCVRDEIAEEFYDPPMSGETILSLLKTAGQDKVNSIAEELIKPWPNTYSYTKAIAESIVKENARSIPAVVFRPGIVLGTLKEPVSGWVDNIYGPTGIIIGVGLGVMRVLLADPKITANIIPVDLTVNAIISCAWEVGHNFNNNSVIENSLPESKESTGGSRKATVLPKIYNFVVDDRNSINWGQFSRINLKWGEKIPTTRSIWYYSLTLTRIKSIFMLLAFFLHYIPGLLIDGICILLGKTPQMLKAYRKIHSYCNMMAVFATTAWNFRNHNVRELYSRLSLTEKELFDFDMEKIDWDTYLSRVVYGIRRYILHETDNTLPAARRKIFFLWLSHRLLQCAFVVCAFWMLSRLLFTYDDLKAHLIEPIAMHSGLLRNCT